MYDRELEQAKELVEAACRVTRAVQDEIAASGDSVTKSDRSPVTVADLAAQAVISRGLAAAFPSDPLMAEEDSSALEGNDGAGVVDRVLDLLGGASWHGGRPELEADLDRGGFAGGPDERFWVLDPVDGTKGFLRGEQYAVALGLVVSGEVVLGVLGCPNLAADPGEPGKGRGCLFAAVLGQGATVQPVGGGESRPVAVDDGAETHELRFCESAEKAHSARDSTSGIAQRLGITKAPVRIDSQCKYGIVARGEASIYLRLPRSRDYREKAWDHAGGSIIVTEAGGKVTDLEGRPLSFSSGRLLERHYGIVATNGHVHEAVLEAARAELGL